ncbi:unnamed protein product [Rotaria sp. Silwood1]|nr:unnamed protein product [Rotaria sp. Silwood1]CAF3659978.1 unnamed protein product [Rotaria sp. Silwood1]CAF3710299.1 unnamed protein product [Rotaria sp. Silwood1]CAF4586877.1 unnamed protein product [Rotaria sp. Silwood1]CAF4735178.1 unnamed protein product [Rotaria sp. Silwood1]
MESYGQAGKVAEEVFSAFRTVLAFNAQNSEQTRYASKLKGITKYAVRKALIYGFYLGLLFTITYWTTALGLLSGAWLINAGKHATLNIGKIVVDHVKKSTRQFKLSTELSVSENAVTLTPGYPIKVTFDNVSFSYPSREEKSVLNNVSFTIHAGKTVALVGSSGSGKSTCVQLLLRFYELTNGQIKINDRNIAEFDIYDYNQAIGVVSQEPILFATSIHENIHFGKKNATQDDVIEASKQAHAHDFIMKLPQGYDTIVGERGVKLSGGQRQRIALARALIRKPNLLILDEATSALDSSSEKIVQQALERASKGRTTIIIAHRLSTIRNADWIVVMQDGAVIEQGSHDDLMAANHIYCGLFKNYQGENLNVQSSEVVNMQESEDFSSETIRDQELNSIRTEENDENEILFDKEETEPMIDEAFNECTVSAQMHKLYIFTSIMFALGIAVVIFTVIAQGCLSVAGARLTNRLRIKAFGCILRQEVGWFDEVENNVGALCSRLSTDALEIQKVRMRI